MGLRDQFKATSTDILKKKIKEEDASLGSEVGKSGYHEINDGTNKFRIYPKHPNSETFYETKTVHWITIEIDGQPKRRTVFNSRVHGGTKFDVIDEYIRMSKEHLSASEDEEATEKLAKITAYNGGLLSQTVWVCYADKIVKKELKTEKKFGQLELKKTMRDGMNKLSVIEDEDDPIVVDPFTDPDDGKVLLLEKSGKEKKTTYSVSLGKNPLPLTDEELEAFAKVKPLKELYKNAYRKQDFDLAVQGLQYFDEENEIGLWETDEWEETLEKIKSQYKDSDNAVNKKSIKDSKPEKKKQEVSSDDDDEEDVDIDEMTRSELKNLIKEQELDIVIKTSMSDDDLREKIRKAISTEESQDDDDGDEEEETQTQKKIEKKSSKKVDEDEDSDDEEEEQPKKILNPKSKVPTLEEIKAKLAAKTGKK